MFLYIYFQMKLYLEFVPSRILYYDKVSTLTCKLSFDAFLLDPQTCYWMNRIFENMAVSKFEA